MPDWKRLATDLYGCVAFAWLCTLNLWHDIQRVREPVFAYYRTGPPGRTLLWGTVTATLMVGLAVFVLQQAAFRLRSTRLRRASRAIFLGSFLCPAFLIGDIAGTSNSGPVLTLLLRIGSFAAIGGVVLLTVWYVGTGAEWPYRAGVGISRLFLPLPAIAVAGLLLGSAPGPDQFRIGLGGYTRPASDKAPVRVVWVIFDEFGYAPAVSCRPKGLKMPELDRLRHEALFAENAYPPGPVTLTSLPGLIDGVRYKKVEVTGVRQLRLVNPDGRSEVWGPRQSLFWAARQRGLETALAGWYHPYCRILGGALSECKSVTASTTVLEVVESHAEQIGIFRTALALLRMQLVLLPGVPRAVAPDIVEIARAREVSDFCRINQAALSFATSARFSVVMAHYPVPHPLGVYDRRTRRLGAFANSTYIDNLALVDRVIGQLRRSLERAGLWGRTSLVISSDHALKSEVPGISLADRRIPFLVRLAGQTTGVEYLPKINTVITKDLIRALYEGRITTPAQLQSWLDVAR